MLRIIKERLRQKYRTQDYPRRMPVLPARYRGLPHIERVTCGSCRACHTACPTGALTPADGIQGGPPALDMGLCTFCGACHAACPQKAITFTGEHRMASFTREGLIITPGLSPAPPPAAPEKFSLFRKSLRLRQVSAGGCNACEADCNVLTTLVFDLGRFGIDFVASPRHADGLLITGPIPENMRQALVDTLTATPEPRVVIAVGACAISGGLFRSSPLCRTGVQCLFPADLFVPGCPPNPWTILDALLSLQGKNRPLDGKTA